MFAARSSLRMVARHAGRRQGLVGRPAAPRMLATPWASATRVQQAAPSMVWNSQQRGFLASKASREEGKATATEAERVTQKELARRVGRRLQEVAKDERVMAQLKVIGGMKEGHVMQWQYLVGNMQTTMDACIAEVFQAAGLEAPANFPEFLYRAVKEEGGQEVRELHSQCWATFVDAAFGPELLEVEGEQTKTSFSLTEARRYVSELVEIFTSSAVLDGMQEAMLKPGWDDMQFRMHCVHEVLLPPHLKLLKKFGFHGEKGYVLAQRSLLVDHLPDRSLLDSSSALSHIVVKYVRQEPAAAKKE